MILRVGRAILNSIILALCGIHAQAAPPEGLEHFSSLLESDPTALELTDFKAKLVTGNLRSLHETVRMLEGAKPGGRSMFFSLLWDADISGRTTAYKTIQAARAGAEVVVLLDGARMLSPLASREQIEMYAAMKREGVKLKVFRPLLAAGLYGGIRRMHDKVAFVESSDGLVRIFNGGRNQSDHYKLGQDTFDVDVRITIDATQARKYYRWQLEPFLRASSTVDWEGPKNYSDLDHLKVLRELRESASLAEYFFRNEMLRTPEHGEVQVKWGVALRNRSSRAAVTRAKELGIRGARAEVTIANAYFIPEPAVKQAISTKLGEGVSVVALTSSKKATEHPNVVRVMDRVVRPLLRGGMQLFLRIAGEVHAKTMTIDRRVAMITSTNLDGRSEFLDTQNGLLLDSPQIARQLNNEVARQVGLGEYIAADQAKVPGLNLFDACMGLLLAPFKKHL